MDNSEVEQYLFKEAVACFGAAFIIDEVEGTADKLSNDIALFKRGIIKESELIDTLADSLITNCLLRNMLNEDLVDDLIIKKMKVLKHNIEYAKNNDTCITNNTMAK